MEARYFTGYGELAWLEPKDYYCGNWRYVCSMVADDDEQYYDIVLSGDSCDMRYTTI